MTHEFPGRKWLVLFAICLVTLMLGIDATALNIAIPVIADEFYASLVNIQWVINSFFLGAAVVQILGGHLGSFYGNRRVFLISLIFFVLASLGAGLSNNEGWLVFFRALQGVSIGITYPLTMVLLFLVFRKEEQSYARSFIVTMMGIALALGAPIGGIFVHTVGWRWIFFVNVPIGMICYLLTKTCCPPDEKTEKKIMDIKGVFLLILSSFAIVFPINQLQNWGFFSFSFWLFFLAGICLLYTLYLVEKKKKERIVHFSFFKKKNFSLSIAIRLIIQLIFLAVLFFPPLFFQNLLSISAIFSGLIMLSLTLSMSIFSPIAGKWVDKRGIKAPTIFALGSLLISSILILQFHEIPNFYLISAALIFAGIGISTALVSTTTGSLQDFPKEKTGSILGIYLTIAWIGCALGVAMSGTAIAYESRSYLAKHLENLPSSKEEIVERVAKGISPLSSLSQVSQGKELLEVKRIAKKAFVKGIFANGVLFFILSFVGLMLSFFLKNPKEEGRPS